MDYGRAEHANIPFVIGRKNSTNGAESEIPCTCSLGKSPWLFGLE
ncbi:MULTISPECIES: hypothetical protein [Pseudoalteromonas]